MPKKTPVTTGDIIAANVHYYMRITGITEEEIAAAIRRKSVRTVQNRLRRSPGSFTVTEIDAMCRLFGVNIRQLTSTRDEAITA